MSNTKYSFQLISRKNDLYDYGTSTNENSLEETKDSAANALDDEKHVAIGYVIYAHNVETDEIETVYTYELSN